MKLFVFIVFLLLVYLYFRNFRNIYEEYNDGQIDQDKDKFNDFYNLANSTTVTNISKSRSSTQVKDLKFGYIYQKSNLYDLIDKYKHSSNTNKNVHEYLTMDQIIGKLNYRKQNGG